MASALTDNGGELAALNRRISSLEEEVALLREQLERSETIAAIQEAQTQVARGEGIPAREAFEMLRQKYNIPPR